MVRKRKMSPAVRALTQGVMQKMRRKAVKTSVMRWAGMLRVMVVRHACADGLVSTSARRLESNTQQRTLVCYWVLF